MRLAIVGASGRMGRAIARLAREAGDEIVCALGATDVGRDVGELAGVGPIGTAVADGFGALSTAGAEVTIDFSSPEATASFVPLAAAGGSAIVCGTTGLPSAARAALERAAASVPVLCEPNMSLGVHVLARLVAEASTALADWDVEIVETHHRAKIDAPSGTALRLAEAVAQGRSRARRVHGRQGQVGPRAEDEVGMHAVRGGDVIGDHVVHFLGGGERLELTHRATSRDVFAHGALSVARWLLGRPAGLYAIRDMLVRPSG